MSTQLLNLSKYPLNEGIYILSKVNNNFENIYLKVREIENRIYSDSELMLLPFASRLNPHKKEWDLRAKSFQRFKKYLEAKKQNLNILDLGCGNGWFCGQLSNSFNKIFYCVDVNLTELSQGRKVFNSERLKFIYADIFNSEVPDASFDIIIVNAAIQYFPNIKLLLDRLMPLLKEKGEIHIIDSPLYSDDEVENAKERTKAYYASIGFPEMGGQYFHHSFSELKDFNYKFLYNPSQQGINLSKLFKTKDSPFPWIVINK